MKNFLHLGFFLPIYYNLYFFSLVDLFPPLISVRAAKLFCQKMQLKFRFNMLLANVLKV